MVVQMAKASGFSSVSDMIDAKGVGNVSNYKRVRETTASPRKLAAPAEVTVFYFSSYKFNSDEKWWVGYLVKASQVKTGFIFLWVVKCQFRFS